MLILGLDDEVQTLLLKATLRWPRITRAREYLIKWKGVNENGVAWDNTWEPAEFVEKKAPELYAKFAKERIPFQKNGMWHNLPKETVTEDVLEELAGYTQSSSSSDDDEV